MTYAITDTLPDAEDLAKEWLLSLPSITSIVSSSGRPGVWLGIPAAAMGQPDTNGNWAFKPFVDVARSGGSPASTDVPVDVARITLNCWAANRPQAKALAKAVVAAAMSLKGSIWTSTTGARIHGAQVVLQLFLPDTSNSRPVPRYVIDVALTTTSA